MGKINKAVLVNEVLVHIPSRGVDTWISIFEEEDSHGVFGVDASFIEQIFDDEQPVIVDSPFGNGKMELITNQ